MYAEPRMMDTIDEPAIEQAARAHTCSTLVTGSEVLALLKVQIPVIQDLERTSFATRRIGAEEILIHSGDPFRSLYVVRSGTFKTVTLDPSGCDQVVAFPIKADVIGIDGIDSGRYAADVIALEASEVVILPFKRLAQLARECPGLENLIYRTISRELVRDQGLLWIIGSLGAEARVAAFLLNFAERLAAIGYSRKSFNLRMTRREIGSYLGLKLETVSRALSAFAAAGWIGVQLKAIELRDVEALRHLIETGAPSHGNALRLVA